MKMVQCPIHVICMCSIETDTLMPLSKVMVSLCYLLSQALVTGWVAYLGNATRIFLETQHWCNFVIWDVSHLGAYDLAISKLILRVVD